MMVSSSVTTFFYRQFLVLPKLFNLNVFDQFYLLLFTIGTIMDRIVNVRITKCFIPQYHFFS